MSGERDDGCRLFRADAGRIKAALGRLAGAENQVVVDRAAAAIEDIEAAAEFVETVGLRELELAVQRAESQEVRDRGKRALAAFRRFRAAANRSGTAASGDAETDGREQGNHFHRGRGTDLRDGIEPPIE